MKIEKCGIEDAHIITIDKISDDRGFFLETFQAARYAEKANIELPFVGDFCFSAT